MLEAIKGIFSSEVEDDQDLLSMTPDGRNLEMMHDFNFAKNGLAGLKSTVGEVTTGILFKVSPQRSSAIEAAGGVSIPKGVSYAIDARNPDGKGTYLSAVSGNTRSLQGLLIAIVSETRNINGRVGLVSYSYVAKTSPIDYKSIYTAGYQEGSRFKYNFRYAKDSLLGSIPSRAHHPVAVTSIPSSVQQIRGATIDRQLSSVRAADEGLIAYDSGSQQISQIEFFLHENIGGTSSFVEVNDIVPTATYKRVLIFANATKPEDAVFVRDKLNEIYNPTF